jgi:arabinose-5-phosphate isomerase
MENGMPQGLLSEKKVSPRLGLLNELFKEQWDLVDDFFDRFEVESAEELLELFLSCKGAIVCTGIGKSGFIANKLAMTLLSTGTKAHFISATDAMHGDIGIVGPDDIFLSFSKSGESDELLGLIPFVRNKGARVVAISSNKDSRLAKAADLHVFLPLKKELCPFNLSPTTSPSIQLLFADVMTTALMMAKNYSLDQYAKNHPAGRIGKRITMKVRDIMISGEGVPFCKPDDLLVDQFVEFTNKRCGCLIVIDDKHQLQGIFTDGDLRRSLQEKGSDFINKPISEVMIKGPKHTDANILAWEAMKLMEANQKQPITVLPVVEDGKVVGIIKLHDLIQAGI